MLVVGTSTSNIYLLNTGNFQVSVFKQAHSDQITGLDSLGVYFASLDKRGNMKLWDASAAPRLTGQILSQPNSTNFGTCVAYGDDPYVLQGFSSGDIWCINTRTNKEEWNILSSHNKGVTTMVMNKTYIITGGNDGCLRIWARTNRKLITQLEMHSAPITKLLVDIKDPTLIHTCSLDKDVHSYSLRKEKKVISHRATNGYFNDMVQSRHNELELSKVK